jgi:hypothetical protein
MLGPVKPRRLDQPTAVSLEDLVTGDHFYGAYPPSVGVACSPFDSSPGDRTHRGLRPARHEVSGDTSGSVMKPCAIWSAQAE